MSDAAKADAGREVPARDAKRDCDDDDDDESSNPRTRGNHSKEAIKILKSWLFSAEHVYHPYPTDKEKEELMTKTGLSKKTA